MNDSCLFAFILTPPLKVRSLSEEEKSWPGSKSRIFLAWMKSTRSTYSLCSTFLYYFVTGFVPIKAVIDMYSKYKSKIRDASP